MKSFMRRSKYILIFIFVAFGLFKVIHWWEGRGQGFRLYKIHSDLPYDARWDISYSEEDLMVAKKALSQPYAYLGHGFQCYAFVSQDGKYVLKFFRHQRLRLPKFVLAMPSLPYFEEWRKSRILSLSRRLDYLLRSCKTSWEPSRRETALLMVHLNTTQNLFPTVVIKDPLGAEHHVALDKCQFLLQKIATLLKPTIAQYMEKGDVAGASEALGWIFELFIDCVHKDVQDTDGALIRKNNLGFLVEEKRAIYIDGGKLKRHVWKEKEFQKDLKRLYLLQKWLKAEYPSLVQPFEEAKAKAIERVEQFIASKKLKETALQKINNPIEESIVSEERERIETAQVTHVSEKQALQEVNCPCS